MHESVAFDGTKTVVLFDELALDDFLPCVWRPMPASGNQSYYSETNLRMLQACLALDDQPANDKGDDSVAQAAEILRLEAKVNLLLDMVGRLLAQSQPRPRPMSVRFNARGAIVKSADTSTGVVQVGDKGLFEVFLHESLVDPLRLFGRVLRTAADGSFELQFDRSSDALVNLIDKLVFRRHRRRIADVRNPKRS